MSLGVKFKRALRRFFGCKHPEVFPLWFGFSEEEEGGKIVKCFRCGDVWLRYVDYKGRAYRCIPEIEEE